MSLTGGEQQWEAVGFNLGPRRRWVTAAPPERSREPVAFSTRRKWICFLGVPAVILPSQSHISVRRTEKHTFRVILTIKYELGRVKWGNKPVLEHRWGKNNQPTENCFKYSLPECAESIADLQPVAQGLQVDASPWEGEKKENTWKNVKKHQ